MRRFCREILQREKKGRKTHAPHSACFHMLESTDAAYGARLKAKKQLLPSSPENRFPPKLTTLCKGELPRGPKTRSGISRSDRMLQDWDAILEE